jgi:outer membrane protein assembly factor BamB
MKNWIIGRNARAAIVRLKKSGIVCDSFRAALRSATSATIWICAVMAFNVLAADWPQWRGPQRTGYSTERLETLPAEPKVNWKIATTEGLSAPVVAGGKVFLFEAEDGKEVLRALNVADAKVLWSTPIDDVMKDNQGPAGPRCTPVVDGDRVYAVSCRGELQCLETATGKKVWSVNYVKDFGAVFIGEKGTAPGASRHGNNGSPLIAGDRLYACAGGTNEAGVVCLDKKTGAVIWKSQSEQAGFAPPVVLNVNGREELICFMASGALALDFNGKLLWRFPVKTAFSRHVATPVGYKDIVVVSSHQAGMFGIRVSADGAEQAWVSKEAAMNFSSPVVVGQYLYGVGPKADVICVDIMTGKLMWTKAGYFSTSADKTEGACIVFGEKILLLTDGGRLVLFEANPNEFKEVATAQVCGLNWCNPAFADGNLYVREGVKTTGQLTSVSLK